MEYSNFNNMMLLSIIVPMYNSEKWLPKCVDSLLHQDIAPEEYEIILVDDGSPDGSRAIAESYATEYSNIVVLTRTNGGTSAARNTGIRAAQGRYLYFVDPDDYILENSLKDILRIMDEESLDVLRFAYTEVDENGDVVSSVKHPLPIDYSSKIMDGCTFMAQRLGVACYIWTYLFRTALIKDNSLYCQEGVYFDDTSWLPQVLMRAERVDSVNVKRHFYLIRCDSLVQDKSPRTVRKKIDGQLYLIEELQCQKRSIVNIQAIKWYRQMLSHCVLALLSLVGQYEYEKRKMFIRFLRDQDVFPLSSYRCSRRNKIKIAMANLSPSLLCLYYNSR